jgi:hypothetical protein
MHCGNRRGVMASRMTKCPECQSWRVETVKIHNPETDDMNANATLHNTLSLCAMVKEERGDDMVTVTFKPDAQGLEMARQLKCLACDHVWEGQVTSPRHQELRRKGRRV